MESPHASVEAVVQHVLDSLVIGAGQAGLSTSFHLKRRGIEHLVLDADDRAGGAWQHRWNSLTMTDVHGVADLPEAPAPERDDRPANQEIPEWFGDYERRFDLPVVRPVRVDRVTDDAGVLVVHAGQRTQRTWRTRTLVNATGTWTRPFVPHYPGIETFAGEQWHTATWPGREHFRGKRVLVVGGGASAVQFLGELAPITEVLWTTRREPVWRTGDFNPDAGLAAVTRVAERVVAGLPPASVVSVTGLMLRAQEAEAAALGTYERWLPMFESLEPEGARWADGHVEHVDAIVWATGFRPALTHLAALHLRSPEGGVRLLPSSRGPQGATTVAVDHRVQLVGYGPSASTIGGNRGGMAAAAAVSRWLNDHPASAAHLHEQDDDSDREQRSA